MHIVGLGTDIIEIARLRRLLERHGEQFLVRVFTPREILACQARTQPVEHFAARWAAKEAVLRALAVPPRAGQPRTELEIGYDPTGRPFVTLAGAVQDCAERLLVDAVLLTLAHCRTYATATALAVRQVPS